MKLNTKQTTFIFAGLVIVTAIFLFGQFGVAHAAKENGKKFEDWSVVCNEPAKGSKEKRKCFLTQQLSAKNEEGKEQPIAFFQFGYFGDKKELRMLQILPLGVHLEAGTSIISSKKFIAPGKYSICMQNGCTSVAPISSADLKTMLAETENAVAFMNIDGQQLNIPFSTKGLEQGLKYLK